MSGITVGSTEGAVGVAVILLISTVGIGGAALGVGSDAAPQTGAAQQENPLETAVRLEPSSATVAGGETTTYDVVVDSADGGVGAYDFSVGVADSNVASISDVAVGGDPSDQTTDVSIADGGSAADVTAALADTDDSGEVTVATVTVRGVEAGTSDIGLTVEALGTEAGESYTVAETTGASVTVEADGSAPEPDPADFRVSNVDAPESATRGDAIDVSADVANDGDEEATQTVEFRLDIDGDGALDEDEVLASREVTLDGGETRTVAFSDLDTSGLDAGDVEHGVFTDDGSATATITIEAADDGNETPRETAVSLEPAESGVSAGETTTYDVVVDSADGGVGAYDFTVTVFGSSITDVAVRGTPPAETTDVSVADDGSSAAVVAALADTDDTGSVTIATVTVRGEIAEAEYNIRLSVDALGTEAGEPYAVTEVTAGTITVGAPDDDGDETDGDETDGDDEEYTLDEIAQAKYDRDFAELSAETSGEVQAIYNRQPFPDGTEPADIRTRDEIATDRYDRAFSDLSRESTIEVQNDYDAQFEAGS